VNVHLSSETFVKGQGIGASELPVIAVLGVTEAAQALTLGGLMAAIVVARRLATELRQAQAQAQT
jgi:hypothetical protein